MSRPCSAGRRCSPATPYGCGWTWVAARAITPRCEPAALRRSSVCRWRAWRPFSPLRGNSTCASAACTRTLAAASTIRITGTRSTRSWQDWPTTSAPWRRSTSAAGCRLRTCPMRGNSTSRDGARGWRESRPRIQAMAWWWSPGAIWWRRLACCCCR